MERLIHQPQEITFDSPESYFYFRGPFRVTPAAVTMFGLETITACVIRLRLLANKHKGLDYLQVFHRGRVQDGVLWIIEDGSGVTALLPSDY